LDARDLSLFPDSSFDAILAMGPFYHLQDSADRVLAAREISRVLRPGGHAFLAFIPRTYIIAQCLATPDYFRSIAAPDKLAEFWKTGCYDSIESGRWTGAYCGKIGEMRNLFLESYAVRTLVFVLLINASYRLNKRSTPPGPGQPSAIHTR
jgi:SAM-dependent methyltransferase